MKPYNITSKFYYDGELEYKMTSTQLRDSPYEAEFSGTDFKGLWDLTSKWSVVIPLGMWEFRKGHPFLQFHNALISRITPKNCKPWKLVVTSEETTITMKRLMQFDTEDVIQYLKERGITICPMNF